MKINNKIPWALVVGMLGVSMTGTFNGAMILGNIVEEEDEHQTSYQDTV